MMPCNLFLLLCCRNYVIQYIIELKNHSIASVLLSQFEGNFVHLSKQKFSSHVVEKCLKFIEKSRSIIIHELVSVPQFEQLLQDPFANYVIQSALGVAKVCNHFSYPYIYGHYKN